jgi:hypothetical protein
MSSSTRPIQPAHLERLRAANAKVAAQRAAAQRRRHVRLAAASVAAVVAVFAGLIVAKAVGGAARHTVAAAKVQPAGVTAQVAAAATSVPAAVLDSMGHGAVGNPPARITGAPALTSAGKPDVVFLSYEWCPFCAAQRWPLVVALSRFGSFRGLGLAQSAADDVYPSTHTFTFTHATYTSPYLAFTPVELQDQNRNPLQRPTAAEQQLLADFDGPPYVPASAAGGIPFLDLGGRFLLSGASYNPQALAGLDWNRIAAALSNPTSPVAQAVDGSANTLTAALCVMTGDQPAAVCTSSAVAAAKGALK